jgi:hypothetical protein
VLVGIRGSLDFSLQLRPPYSCLSGRDRLHTSVGLISTLLFVTVEVHDSYVAVMVVGSLIFVLGIDLVKEALWDTRRRVSRYPHFYLGHEFIDAKFAQNGIYHDCEYHGVYDRVGFCDWCAVRHRHQL